MQFMGHHYLIKINITTIINLINCIQKLEMKYYLIIKYIDLWKLWKERKNF